MSQPRDVTPDEAAQLLGAEAAVTYVDVRSTAEYTQGHVPGSINVPLAEAGPAPRHGSEPRLRRRRRRSSSRPTSSSILGCASGGRSRPGVPHPRRRRVHEPDEPARGVLRRALAQAGWCARLGATGPSGRARRDDLRRTRRSGRALNAIGRERRISASSSRRSSCGPAFLRSMRDGVVFSTT